MRCDEHGHAIGCRLLWAVKAGRDEAEEQDHNIVRSLTGVGCEGGASHMYRHAFWPPMPGGSAYALRVQADGWL